MIKLFLVTGLENIFSAYTYYKIINTEQVREAREQIETAALINYGTKNIVGSTIGIQKVKLTTDAPNVDIIGSEFETSGLAVIEINYTDTKLQELANKLIAENKAILVRIKDRVNNNINDAKYAFATISSSPEFYWDKIQILNASTNKVLAQNEELEDTLNYQELKDIVIEKLKK